jgi:hypothetical protein
MNRNGEHPLMKKTILLFTSLLLLPFFAERTFACSCAGQASVCEAYQGTTAVFIGTVLNESIVQVQIEVDIPGKGKETRTNSEKSYLFAVEQSFKGVEGTSIEVQTELLSNCGYEFKKGERYLVYTYLDGKTRKFHTSKCSRTKALSDASEDLDFLRGLPDSLTTTRISGEIIQYTQTNTRSYVPKRMSGVKVILSGEKTFESVTNEEGVYFFVGMPPGTYKLKAELPATLSNREMQITIPVAGCLQIDIDTRTDGRIAGSIVDSQGQIIANAKVGLIPANPDKNQNSHSIDTDKEGRYEFTGIPPGEYYLGVNIDEEPKGNLPYPRTFYPGTADRTKATVIALAEGEKIAGYNLTLPPALAVKTIEGVFVWSDGRPVNFGEISLTELPDPKKTGRVYASVKVDAQGRFSLQGFDGIKCWIHGSTYSTVDGTIHIEPVKILVTGEMKPVKLIAPSPKSKSKEGGVK